MEIWHNQDTFKVMQITDAHLHYLNSGPPEEDTLAFISKAIDDEKPDLVISTGDLIYSDRSATTLRGFCEFMAAKKQRWAFAFGNHDAEFGASQAELGDILERDPWCLYTHGASNVKGHGNFAIKVFDKEGGLSWIFYLLDSGNTNKNQEVGGYDYIDHTQIAWYVNTRNDYLSRYGNHPSLFFFHIPLPEYEEMWRTQTCYGYKFENVSGPRVNSGFFTAMLEENGAKGIFVGHNHTNDYHGKLHGLHLCYGRGTGFEANGRGAYGKEGFLRGVRIIECDMEIKPNVELFSTYLYLEGGIIVNNQPPHEPEGI